MHHLHSRFPLRRLYECFPDMTDTEDSCNPTREGGMQFTDLPADCIAYVIALTSPRDACVMATVSKWLKEVADSDYVWQSFLPKNYRSIAPGWDRCPSIKKLYQVLCDEPFLIDGDRTSVSLDKESGSWCYMPSARNIEILWTEIPRYGRWISHPDARFPEVLELLGKGWFDIRIGISTRRLSANTHYLTFLVFKHRNEFKTLRVKSEVGILGKQTTERLVRLVEGDAGEGQKRRGDSWLEIELGEFFNTGESPEELQVRIFATKNGNAQSGLIIQGVELRPIC